MVASIALVTLALRVPCPSLAQTKRAALENLVRAAAASNSDALVVSSPGSARKVWHFSHNYGPILTQSVTKSIVSLALGYLVDRGFSLDTSASNYFPEWRNSPYAAITVRHLLTMSSGLGIPQPDFENPRDMVRPVLSRAIVATPGERFIYSHAVNLLGEIVRIESGEPLDRFVEHHLLRPLGIKRYLWERDAVGHPIADHGLSLLPEDLAKIGELVLNEGRWEHKQILSKHWIRESTTPAKFFFYAMLWWIEPHAVQRSLNAESQANMLKAGFSKAQVAQLRWLSRADLALDTDRFSDRVANILGADAFTRWKSSGLFMFAARTDSVLAIRGEGSGGQDLCIFPRQHIVIVRLISTDRRAASKSSFVDFFRLARAYAEAT